MTFQINEVRRQRLVVLTLSRWEHIITGHPGIEPLGREMAACLTSSDFVFASEKYADRELYYKRLRQHGKAWTWIKVVVSFADPELGEVIRAFLTYNLRGGKILWQQPRLRL